MMRTFRLALGLLFALAVVLTASASAAQGQRDYLWFTGSGFICGLEPDACPDVARARNGDTIEIIGEGTFTVRSDGTSSVLEKSITGGGTFVHKDRHGNVLGQGTFAATALLGYESWGSGAVQGLPPETEGGRIWVAVHLTPDGGGPGFDGLLRVTCELGDRIPPGVHEGVTLKLDGGPNFNREVSGLTLFIRL